ncbi:MAG: hypothetical protein IPI59_04845 [Sphingobacteriales bacterium]|nr:hypothetical protein [Sphingobacteriales bacterium]
MRFTLFIVAVIWLFGAILISNLTFGQANFFKNLTDIAVKDNANLAIPDYGNAQTNPFFKTLVNNGIRSFYAINPADLAMYLSQAPNEDGNPNASGLLLPLPLPDGSTVEFEVKHSQIVHEKLRQKYPELATFTIQGFEHKSASGRICLTKLGFHAFIFMPHLGKTLVIDPYHLQATHLLQVYFLEDTPKPGGICSVGQQHLTPEWYEAINNKQKSDFANGDELHIYRIAISVEAEYTNKYGGVDNALAATVQMLNDLNAITEHEIAVRFEMVANNNLLMFTDPATDPYNGNNNDMLDQNQTAVSEKIGWDNYDLGIVLRESDGVGGVAYVGNVCGDLKGKLVSANAVLVLAHEVGHQCGAMHTFNSIAGGCNGNRSGDTAYEPGSGNTLMGYFGLCGNDDMPGSELPNYHANSFESIIKYMFQGNGASCAQIQPTGNTIPTLQVPASNFFIPIATPFYMAATANDPDNQTLTYSWEQYDLGPAGTPNEPQKNAPLFRVFGPVEQVMRTFPQISDIVNNTHTLGELLPNTNRDLHFRCVVRDNAAGGGAADFAEVAFKTTDFAGPFLVLSPNGNEKWTANTTRTVKWDVANTNLTPVNCQKVNIMFSADGGYSYEDLALDLPNTGSATVTVPNLPGNTFRIAVVAADNVFFDISDANFTIYPETNIDYELQAEPSQIIACTADTVVYNVLPYPLGTYSADITITANGLPAGTSGYFENNGSSITLKAGQTTTFTVVNVQQVQTGNYPITLTANSDSVRTATIELVLPGTSDPNANNALEITSNNGNFTIQNLNWQPNEFTVEFWLYPYDLANFNQSIGEWGKFKFHTSTKGAIYCGTDANSRFDTDDIPEGAIKVNEWQHIAFVYDNGRAYMYKNGDLLATKIWMEKSAPWTDGLKIGAVGASAISGRLDEFRIWGVVRTTTDIRQNMHQALTACETGLKVYYQFNQITKSTVVDVTGAHNGKPLGGIDFIASSLPLAQGATASLPETAEFTPYNNADIEAASNSPISNAKLTIASLNATPNSTQGVDAETIYSNRYWVAWRHENNSKKIDANLRFTLPYDLTAIEAANPLQMILFGRPAGSDGPWSIVTVGNEVNADSNTVTFNNVPSLGQYLVSRSTKPIISTNLLPEFCPTPKNEWSNELSYNIKGVNLTEQVVITPPNNVQISTVSGKNYVEAPATITLNPDAQGTLPSQKIYVRFKPTGNNTFNETITHESVNAQSSLVQVVGTTGEQYEGFSGNGLQFDGVDDYAVFDPTNLYINNFTLACWVRPDGPQKDFCGLVFTRHESGVHGISLTDKNELRYHWNDGYWTFGSNLILPDKKWSYVAIVVTPSKAYLFLNGQYAQNTADHEPANMDGDVRIAHDSYGDRFFKGQIDEIRIWNRALGTGEVRQTMHPTMTLNDNCLNGLVHYFQFNQVDGDFEDVIGGVKGSLQSNTKYVPSSGPFGKGVAVRKVENDGPLVFENTNLLLNFDYAINASIVVTKLAIEPWGLEGLYATDTPLSSQYWIVERYGNGAFKCDLTFTPSEPLEAYLQGNPNQLALYYRPFNSDSAWTLLKTADAVDIATNSATFNDITQFNYQYLLAKQTCANPVTAQIQLQLEGLYNKADKIMNNDLLTLGVLPKTQPFNSAPYFYTGAETVVNFPDKTVNWVLVEFRNKFNFNQIVERHAAILLADGTLVNPFNNTSGVPFNCHYGQAVYITVNAWGHLGAMSSNPVLIEDGVTLYNFGLAGNSWGNIGTILLPDLYGLPVGDVNADGVISVFDFNELTAKQGQSGYLPADLNGDGQINNNDIGLYLKNATIFWPKKLRW